MEQNDLFMDFEDFQEEGEEESDEESYEDDGSWEDASTSEEGEDDGEIGEEGVVDDDYNAPMPAAATEASARGTARLGAEGAPDVPQPYLHEPPPRQDDDDGLFNDGDAPRDVDPHRLMNNDWCLCGGHCRVEPSFSAGDSTCCREIPEVSFETDALGVDCLTTTEAFESAILNPISLYIGWMEYTDRWRRAARAFGNRNNEKYRYVAYRKVVRWCWGFLGKDIRVQLPACIHSKIMRAYPDGAGIYKGTVLRVLRR
ncbi:uncharacterized protein LOC135153562 [Lytechinus pictus]|uniref:uncharacterized protein LOC135153562 n=1 Tax=Lytechinus pictus TaxID=7653 RepID=UPI0030BA234E